MFSIVFSPIFLFFSFYLELRRFGAAIDPICYVTIPLFKIQAYSGEKERRAFVDFSVKIWCNKLSLF